MLALAAGVLSKLLLFLLLFLLLLLLPEAQLVVFRNWSLCSLHSLLGFAMGAGVMAAAGTAARPAMEQTHLPV
jgi:hypothetical protein